MSDLHSDESDLPSDDTEGDETHRDRIMPETLVNEIDLYGDTWLSVREKPEGNVRFRLRVRKAVLSSASSYFRALFSTPFPEGPVARNGKDVEMLEEKGAAFTTMMRIIHICLGFARPFKPCDALDFAVVVDKYDCTEAVKLFLSSVMPSSRPDYRSFEDQCLLISASYLLDSPELFTKYTADMVTDFVPFDLENPTYLCIEPVVPTAVYVIIQSRQSSILKQLLELVASLLHAPCVNMGPECPRSLSYHLRMHKALRAVGPVDTKSEAIRKTYERISKLVLPLADTSERLCDGYAHCEEMDSRKMDRRFLRMLYAISHCKTGLCIDCVKNERWNEQWTRDCRSHTSRLGMV